MKLEVSKKELIEASKNVNISEHEKIVFTALQLKLNGYALDYQANETFNAALHSTAAHNATYK